MTTHAMVDLLSTLHSRVSLLETRRLSCTIPIKQSEDNEFRWEYTEKEFQDEATGDRWRLPDDIETDFNKCMLEIEEIFEPPSLSGEGVVHVELSCSLVDLRVYLNPLPKPSEDSPTRLEFVIKLIQIRPCAVRRGLFHRVISHVLKAIIPASEVTLLRVYSCGENSRAALWNMPLPDRSRRTGEPSWEHEDWIFAEDTPPTFYHTEPTMYGRADIMLDRPQFRAVKAALDAKIATTPFPTRAQLQTPEQEEFSRAAYEFNILLAKALEAKDDVINLPVRISPKEREMFLLKEASLKRQVAASWIDLERMQERNPDCTVRIYTDEIVWSDRTKTKFDLTGRP